jgi:hypothetical protein
MRVSNITAISYHSKHSILFPFRKPIDLNSKFSAPCFQNDMLFSCGMMVAFATSCFCRNIEAKKEDRGIIYENDGELAARRR